MVYCPYVCVYLHAHIIYSLKYSKGSLMYTSTRKCILIFSLYKFLSK